MFDVQAYLYFSLGAKKFVLRLHNAWFDRSIILDCIILFKRCIAYSSLRQRKSY